MSRQRSDENIVLFGGIEVDIGQFDLSDRSSRVSSVKIANIVFIVLVVLTVGLRIFARAKYVRHIFADDGTCIDSVCD
jgi:fumarate reductase subunit D